VIVPIVGAGGAVGAGLITTFAVGSDVHPASLVTVKLYVPGRRSAIFAVVPLPATLPGFIVHTPVAGSPLNATLPVGIAQDEG
jgi:hypothetical protein